MRQTETDRDKETRSEADRDRERHRVHQHVVVVFVKRDLLRATYVQHRETQRDRETERDSRPCLLHGLGTYPPVDTRPGCIAIPWSAQ